ncbi:molecular chaperone HscB [Candidatus Kinetoplastibacterium oncopeltii TCC290E]|uniref:Co-chaperone protein HscB homolog n=1 Tax=Candidatus Kinetoplastidibacterium stringomonadis TCC290E TaxID=1208920 RepID=M1L6S1_9PROT|nr:Fe-S protein assembly co-chaperone HscB [Candidatus Kinetoplastibacterium oncopeltii]AGF48258.1 molecular chaperone HscB [Candidatus Kinetoplastibacterium oncopeltii TCC290E]
MHQLNYFSTFGLPVSFSIDQNKLEKSWRHLSCIVHPDRYINSDDIDRKSSIEMASFVNEAYKVLKDPISRAIHICKINGISCKKTSDNSIVFLEQQLLWRESVDDLYKSKDLDGLKKLEKVLYTERDERFLILSNLLDVNFDYINASILINELMFIDKICNNIKEKILVFID